MEHCRGHNHYDAPSSWFSGPARRAPECDQVHHGHHPPRDPDAHFDRAAPVPHRASPLAALLDRAVATFGPLLNTRPSDRDGA
jgi:hypothetical protein